MIVHRLEAIKVEHEQTDHRARTRPLHRRTQRVGEAATVRQSRQRIGVRHRQQNLFLIGRALRRLPNRARALSQHIHEHQHVERRADLKRVQRPKTRADLSANHARDDEGANGVHQPRQHQRHAHLIATPRALHRNRKRQQRGHQPEHRDDRDQRTIVERIQTVHRQQHHAKPRAAGHNHTKPSRRLLVRQHLIEKQKRTKRCNQRADARRVALKPKRIGPQKLRAGTKLQHRKQHAAKHQNGIRKVLTLPKQRPLNQAIRQQHQRHADQHALHHLLLQRCRVKRRRPTQARRQHQRAVTRRPHINYLRVARRQRQRHRMATAA